MFGQFVLKGLYDPAKIRMSEVGDQRANGAGSPRRQRLGRRIGNPTQCSNRALELGASKFPRRSFPC